MLSYDQLLKMSGQKCYTLSIDSEATMLVDQNEVTIIYPSGRELTIPRDMVVEGINWLRNNNRLSVYDVHEKITHRHRTRTDKLMAVLRKLPGVTFRRIPRELYYNP